MFNISINYQKIIWVALCFGSIMLAGCAKTMQVEHYSPCYSPDINTVVIATFKNDTHQKNAGEAIAFHLASVLRVNGTYTIIGPRKLDESLQKYNKKISDLDYKAQAKEIGKITHADAFITGTVLSDSVFKSTYSNYYYSDSYYDGDYDYYQPYWMHPYYQGYVTEAYISVTASMISVPDGQVICSTAKPVKGASSVEGTSPEQSHSASEQAVFNTVKQLEYQFAIVPLKVQVYPDNIRVATGKKNDNWRYTDTFKKDNEQMYVIVHLPAKAAKNDFSLTVTPQKQNNVLFSRPFTWKSGEKEQSFSFSPRQIAAKSGTGNYTVNLCRSDKVIISRDFNIRN